MNVQIVETMEELCDLILHKLSQLVAVIVKVISIYGSKQFYLVQLCNILISKIMSYNNLFQTPNCNWVPCCYPLLHPMSVASAWVMLIQVMFQSVPATAYPDHNVVTQNLNNQSQNNSNSLKQFSILSCINQFNFSRLDEISQRGGYDAYSVVWRLLAQTKPKSTIQTVLTLMNIKVFESPTLYFPSLTLTIGNCVGHVHIPKIY